jgi:hypothetical protein
MLASAYAAIFFDQVGLLVDICGRILINLTAQSRISKGRFQAKRALAGQVGEG